MKKISAIILVLLLGAFQGVRADEIFSLYTAVTRGTYAQIGLDIQKACPKLKVELQNTNGSLENMNELIRPPVMKVGHRFALVQEDVLTSVFSSEPRAKHLVRPVMQMFSEDIMIMANRNSNVRALKDLHGKRVAIGPRGSGTWFTANAIKSRSDINWVPVERTKDESLLAVLVGDIDAIVIVGGHPIQAYMELSESMKDRIHLIDLNDISLDSIYPRKTLKAFSYPWQEKSVITRQTDSLMIAAADVPPAAIKEFTSCLVGAKQDLLKWGHPKWKTVNFKMLKGQF